MEKIILGKRKGKTTKLIKLSDKTRSLIVCRNTKEAHRIEKEAKSLGYNIPFPVTYYEFFSGKYYGNRTPGFLIDNIEEFIQFITPVPINAITITKSSKPSKSEK